MSGEERPTDPCPVYQATLTAGPGASEGQLDLLVRLRRQRNVRPNRSDAGGNKPWSRWLLPLVPRRP